MAGVLLQPLCQAAGMQMTAPQPASLSAAQNPGDNESCCSLMPDTALVQAAQALASHAGSGALADGLPIAHRLYGRPAAIDVPGGASARPPPVTKYHARSARILN